MIFYRVSARHFAVACSTALLLISIHETAHADEAVHSKLSYGNGKEFQTVIYDARLVAQVPVRDKEPVLFFTGRRCLQCNADTEFYYELASNGPGMWGTVPARPPYLYPGDYYASESGMLVARVHTFIGQCLDSRQVVVSFIHKVVSGASQDDLNILVVNDGSPGRVGNLPEDALKNLPSEVRDSLLGSLMATAPSESPRDIAVARSAVSRKVCREIPPLRKIVKTAADFEPPKLPSFRTDCSSPAPLPSEIPLADGGPGRSLSFLDEQTNTLLYVESDGRHVAAMSADGELLWVRNPFVDRDLCPYRVARPIIVHLGMPSWSGSEASVNKLMKREGHFVEIQFNSSQFGVVNVKNGDFFFEGQN